MLVPTHSLPLYWFRMWMFSQQAVLLLQLIVSSGRATSLSDPPSARLAPIARIAPGPPPLLSFRYFDGQAKHRFGNFDLVVDDANH